MFVIRGLCPPGKNSSHQGAGSEGTTNSNHSVSSHRGSVTDGCLVRLKNGPPCGPNSIVFNQTGPKPRVGKTMNIIEHSGLDPKTSILVKVYRDTCVNPVTDHSTDVGNNVKQKSKLLRELENEALYGGLEVWSLSDVTFLDDSPAILGRVVTVDQLQAIVDISHASSETGTMDSTSPAQSSTLKVFKLSEIESCVDGGGKLPGKDRMRGSSKGVGGGRGSGGRDDHSPSTMMQDDVITTVSHHIAGLVQHRPVCLLTPSPPSTPLGLHPLPRDNDSMVTTCVHGYYPLAIHTTDSGPIMLVKRVSDGTAFLVCSGHTGFPSFSSSSFVSVSSHDNKPGRCTIDEEAILAKDGGIDRTKWLLTGTTAQGGTSPEHNGLDPHLTVEDKGLSSNISSENNGLKLELNSSCASPMEDNGVLSHSPLNKKGLKSPVKKGSSLSSDQRPSFISLHKSTGVLLQDANGILHPLANGLCLRPHPHGERGGAKGRPGRPYKCMVTRSYRVRRDTTVLILIAGN